MKKIFTSFLFLCLFSLTLVSCDNRATSDRKENCSRYLEKKSDEFKNCIKSDDHLFVYSLETKIQRFKNGIEKHNNFASRVNSIKLDTNKYDYESVNFPEFLKLNFLDSISLLKLKNNYALEKKIKFKADFKISYDDNDNIDLTLFQRDDLDHNNFLFMLSNSAFQNIKIQKKIINKKNSILIFRYPPTKSESLIYGYFDQAVGSYSEKYAFYIEDIEMYQIEISEKEIIEELIGKYALRVSKGGFMGEDTYRPSVDEVKSNVRKLMDDILKN
ncbi:MAG: hypothetical protein ISQ17_03320 [Pelagibacteraceae bacterium]|nr:hypothetical protein [Pelagibacteraceae bacterium]